MGTFALGLEEIDHTQTALVGGKAASLGELSRIEGIDVPEGFCVTTDAFRLITEGAPWIEEHLDQLSQIDAHDHEAIRTTSAGARQAIEAAAIPDEVITDITDALARVGEHRAHAVRSSATVEDLPGASFAGQQDTYLNVVGLAGILEHVSRCWASLFTERAVAYRIQNGFGHRSAHMAVVVQRMVFPEAAGVLFTADPVTSDRTVTRVEAVFGLGHAFVSGLVDADAYEVRHGQIVARAIATKERATVASRHGGTREQPVELTQQDQPALTDEQVLEVARLGRRIEAHHGCPQDIEWCLADGAFQIVQSRPITTLFPIPHVDDDDNHVYVSVGHQQMMTDAMKPLGLSVWQLTTPRPMAEAGSRLFVDVTPALASPTSRSGLLAVLGTSDPLIRDALETVLDRDFVPAATADGPGPPPLPGSPSAPVEPDPALVADLVADSQASIAALQRAVEGTSGTELLDVISADFAELQRHLFDPRSLQPILAAMDATTWLNEHLEEWLGERNVADTLTQSVPDNVTSEMGLALLDVADAIRPYPDVVDFLRNVDDDDFLDALPRLDGGPAARDAIQAYLDRYGMRCAGEIDITRPRWSERPATLVPMILANVDGFEPGAAAHRFEQGRQEAERTAREVLERLRALPDGERMAADTQRRIDLVRTFIGYREYPKYGMVSRYLVYKQALLREARRLVDAGILQAEDDVFFLRFPELYEVVRTDRVDADLVRRRRTEFRSHESLTPPRVLTSDGEAISGTYRRDDVPAGALVGLAVSAGTVEGRARVILDMAKADLEPGDILVTAHTDPSWSPLFVAAAALVTEVGGLMTHGAVVAREYGLPAVVGVAHATRLIEDGRRIRVNGTGGYVELLPMH